MNAIEPRAAEAPTPGTTQQASEDQITKLYASTDRILSNLRSIRDKLPNQNTTANTRDAILKMCRDFEWAIGDVRMEVRGLEDNLGMHPGEEPFHHGMESDNPTKTMGFIRDWLAPQIAAMHDLVIGLRVRPENDLDAALLSLLLHKSAANIIREAIAIKDALNTIAATLNQRPARQNALPPP